MVFFKSFKSVTPNDASDLPSGTCWGLVCDSTAGLVKVTTEAGDELTLYLEKENHPLLGRFKRVWSTGTTAVGIRALYQPVRI